MSNSWWFASEESEKVFIFPPIWQFQGGSHSRSPGISTHRWNVLLPRKQVSNQHKYNSTMEKANFPPPKKQLFKCLPSKQWTIYLATALVSPAFYSFLEGHSSFKFLPCLVDQFAQVFRLFLATHAKHTCVLNTTRRGWLTAERVFVQRLNFWIIWLPW